MKKVIQIEDQGFIWHIPLEHIADHRAKYYEKNDKDTTYEEEYNYVMNDNYEGVDWFLSNMNWSDVAIVAKLMVTPSKTKPDNYTMEAKIANVIS